MMLLDHVNEYSAVFLKNQQQKQQQKNQQKKVYFSREFTELEFVNSMKFTHLM